jgi:hypothetical protein
LPLNDGPAAARQDCTGLDLARPVSLTSRPDSFMTESPDASGTPCVCLIWGVSASFVGLNAAWFPS